MTSTNTMRNLEKISFYSGHIGIWSLKKFSLDSVVEIAFNLGISGVRFNADLLGKQPNLIDTFMYVFTI